MDDRGRGVASVAPRPARAAAACAACAARLRDGLHHGLRLLERCVLRTLCTPLGEATHCVIIINP